MKRIYLDHAATTPVDPAVAEAMRPYLAELFGNPLSPHAEGTSAGAAVERARKSVAALIGARRSEIVFTSGGTEGNNAALKGVAYANRDRGDHIITSLIEHESILATCEFLERQGFRVTYLPVDRHGSLDAGEVAAAIDDRTILISIMLANNEVGTVQPLADIGKVARKAGVYLHTDAVQAFGHLPIKVRKLSVDLLTISGHKAYAPKGVGALYLRRGTRIEPLLHGGAHEAGRRASTLNVPGIVGLGRAAELAKKRAAGEAKAVEALRCRLVASLSRRFPDLQLNGHPTRRLPGIASFSFPHAHGDLMLQQLDKLGVACSTGSTCRIPGTAPSHVLTAIGLPPELERGTLRFSLGHQVTAEDIDYLAEVLPGVVAKSRALAELLE